MKKTFPLTHPKINPARLVESIQGDVNKYIKRERSKKLPEGVDFWDFDCKVGVTAETAESTHVTKVSKAVAQVLGDGGETCYVELIAKPGVRMKKPRVED
ncbi:MAG: DUF6172 family protein [Opitutales bacterium]|jgi:hypothetical protein|nr:DUF6172 family protein [Opitutales bacterium]MDP4643184.1 DUF6172 family protein [Opitutales bacterium]MDP4693617.1 DUF6172 family protein [Opitutales bacterium]MDP4776482.1 DUF6172 family protein [Opitutales bacterium]MDP4880457.1 DUF6172 family protein [Opitutales bacterium]